MELELAPGKYVVAVSGGVDSVVLLDLLAHSPQFTASGSFVVAHFDHGIRTDSESDRVFVQKIAEKYGVEFMYKREELGEAANEALARARRYEFLNYVKQKTGAKAIVTAHHADDDLETACINILRGTFRKGISSLHSQEIVRPLLHYSKKQIIEYANHYGLQWREDSTNLEQKYLRNRLRRRLQDAEEELKNNLQDLIHSSATRNFEIDELCEEVFSFGFDPGSKSFDRGFFISLPYSVSCEITAYWLRQINVEFSNNNISLLTVHLKTGRNRSRFNAGKNLFFTLDGRQIRLDAN